MSIATTILAQLGGAGRLSAMIGARDFMDNGNGLGFRFTAKGTRSINRVRVTLAPDDTYTVEFWSVRGVNATLVATVSDVYADSLRETIEHYTGLALSL